MDRCGPHRADQDGRIVTRVQQRYAVLPRRPSRCLVASVLLLLGSCSFFPESSFDLAPDSPLPRWFTLPVNLTRSQVNVHLDYYLDRKATFTLLGPNREVLAKVKGLIDGDAPKQLKAQQGNSAAYPSYEIISVGAVSEIIEHRRMEPIFYISRDPAVWVELAPAKATRP